MADEREAVGDDRGRHLAAHRGGLIKTIGDSILAVFPDPGDGVAAALDLLTIASAPATASATRRAAGVYAE